MLKSKVRTPEETAQYMAELKAWLREEREKPAEEMAAFFFKRLENYEDVHLGNWALEYEHIADFFEEPLNSLLDIGCGTGLELEAMYRRFPNLKVTGIDLSKDMLKKLEEKYWEKAPRLVVADYFEYAFEEEAYGAALSFETLHHFKYEKKQKIYKKLFRALQPGGYYIECDYIACCPEEEEICQEQYSYKRKKSQIPEEEFIHIDIPLTLEHQKELMVNAGFKSVKVLYENCGTMVLKAEK